MKRRILIAVLVFTLLSILSTAVSAGTVTASPFRETIAGYDEAFERMYLAAADGKNGADLTDLKLQDKEVIQLYADLVAASPELFYLDSRIIYHYTFNGIRKNVTTIEFVYRMDEEERNRAKIEYETELAYIVSLADPAMTDAEKALWVHDYLIDAFVYDESLTNYDAHALFTERKGVCQAYSLAYAAIMRELGVEAVMVVSSEMNHAWNLVKLEDSWYHVDLVYDDLLPDRVGRVLHENFLLDDSGIRGTKFPHSGWQSSIACTDNRYAENGIWHGVESRMIYLDKQWYYVDSENKMLISSLFDGRYPLDVFSFKQKWAVQGSPGTYWQGIYSGVAECLGYLFFNTPDAVYSYDPDTGKNGVFMEINDRTVFGCTIYKNALECFCSDSPDDSTGERRVFTITDYSPRPQTSPLPFEDVSRLDPWYSDIRYVYDKGLFQGVSSTRFAPDAALTRAMFVTVLGRLFGIDPDEYNGSRYEDVGENMWYSPYVEWASRKNIVNGTGEGMFNPMGEITREQMYLIVARCGLRLKAGELAFAETVLTYTDAGDISDWAYGGVLYCVKNNLASEESMLRPGEKATRAEAAVIISRFAILCGLT